MVLDDNLRRKLDYSYKYCRDLARAKAGNFYYAFVFLPEVKRRAIYALYAFCQYGDQIVDENDPEKDPEREIEQLRRDLVKCYQGVATTPLFFALYDTIRRFNLPSKIFFQLIDGIKRDIHQKRYENFDELREYCYGVASTVGLLCVEIFGYKDEVVKDYAENLGFALQLTNIIRDVKEDMLQGRIYLPMEDIRTFGYSVEELEKSVYNENFRRLMQYQYTRALDYYQMAVEALPLSERRSEAASEIMRVIYRELLETIKAVDFKVLERRICLSKSRKLALAIKTYTNVMLGMSAE